MNCAISDAPVWRAINTLLDDVTEPAEVIVLTSDISATDLARHVLTHPAASGCQVTVISGQSVRVDPAVDLIAHPNYQHAWLNAINPEAPPVFNGNIVLVNAGGRVSAAVGSAPLAHGRWASDREVWTVLRERCGCSPLALHELAEMLYVLALSDTHCALDPQAAFALYTTARDIEKTEAVDTGARFLSNYHYSIAERLYGLISGPVDDLALYSPEYHPRLRGIDTLTDIFQPTATITLYATDRTRPNDRTLNKRVSADGEQRTVYVPSRWARAAHRNASVIQWRTRGQTFAITGLSTRGQYTLRYTAEDIPAGFETAVLSQTDTPLLPWSPHIDPHWQARVLPLPSISTEQAA